MNRENLIKALGISATIVLGINTFGFALWGSYMIYLGDALGVFMFVFTIPLFIANWIDWRNDRK